MYKKHVYYYFIFLMFITSAAIARTNELVLQEGLNSYSGTEDATLVDPEAEVQVGQVKGAEKERLIMANYRC